MASSNNSTVAITDPALISDFLRNKITTHLRLGRSPKIGRTFQNYSCGSEFKVNALATGAILATEGIEVPKHLVEQSSGFSGSLTDYMFGASVDRPTFIIGTNDTLVSIAESLFHDRQLAYLIAQLNKDRTNQYNQNNKLIVEAKAREVLKLPVGEDIDEFKTSDDYKQSPDRIITIVSDSSLNREIVEEVLNPVVAPVSPWSLSTVRIAKLKSESDRIKLIAFCQVKTNRKPKLNRIIQNGIKVNRSVDH